MPSLAQMPRPYHQVLLPDQGWRPVYGNCHVDDMQF